MRLYYLAPVVLLGACAPEVSDEAALGGDPKNGSVDARPVTKPKVAGDGPFGIERGTPISDLDANGERDIETGLSVLSSVPKASSQFPQVAVISYPQTGVCSVRALSRVFESDPYLTSAMPFADEVASALESRYGPGKKDDGCTGYSCSSEYKLQHVQDGSFWYSYGWKASQGRVLPQNVSNIDLYVIHSQYNDSQVRLDYSFDNLESCKSAERQAKAGNL